LLNIGLRNMRKTRTDVLSSEWAFLCGNPSEQ